MNIIVVGVVEVLSPMVPNSDYVRYTDEMIMEGMINLGAYICFDL
jgi:hypothetical protein